MIDRPSDDSQMNGWTPGMTRPVGPRFGARWMSSADPFVPMYARPTEYVRPSSRWTSTFQMCTYPRR